MTTREHVLELPRFILILRFVQIVLALAVLGISAYAISNYAVDAEALLIYCVRVLNLRPLPLTNKILGYLHPDRVNVCHRGRDEIPYHLQLLGHHGS